MTWIDWLNSNPTLIIAIASTVTAAATFLIAVSAITTAWLTRQLANENRLVRQATSMPKVVAYFASDPRDRRFINFVLENVGLGPAQDVSFSLDADVDDLKAHHVATGFTRTTSNTGADLIPPGGHIHSLFGHDIELLGEHPLETFSVHLNYKDLQGRRYQNTSEMDVTHFNWISWIDR